jgi:hypothetical protein
MIMDGDVDGDFVVAAAQVLSRHPQQSPDRAAQIARNDRPGKMYP